MGDTGYADAYRDIDFRKHPDKYVVGRGEQGVLIAEPYKSEILPHWKFKDPEVALKSAKKIYAMFKQYKAADDFVGMDMSRKFLMMGWTRARRYANHSSGNKYDKDGNKKPQDKGSEDSVKAESAAIFRKYYLEAENDTEYRAARDKHKQKS